MSSTDGSALTAKVGGGKHDSVGTTPVTVGGQLESLGTMPLTAGGKPKSGAMPPGGKGVQSQNPTPPPHLHEEKSIQRGRGVENTTGGGGGLNTRKSRHGSKSGSRGRVQTYGIQA